MKRLALVLVLLATTLAAAPNPVTTVILVRHAEKASEDRDAVLSDPGLDRAKELARVLSGVKVDAIYTTQFQRTKQTVAPLAEASGIAPVARNAGNEFPAYATDLAKEILAQHRGKTVVVSGHSDSTIDVMTALGATGLPKIEHAHYDNLFVLTDVEGAAPKVLALRFGASR